jgi:hypothetical protein
MGSGRKARFGELVAKMRRMTRGLRGVVGRWARSVHLELWQVSSTMSLA